MLLLDKLTPYKKVFMLFLTLTSMFTLAACAAGSAATTPTASPTTQAEITAQATPQVDVPEGFNEPSAQASPTANEEASPENTAETIEIDPSAIVIDLGGETQPINSLLFGTNVPAWLSNWRTEDQTFIEKTLVSGVTLLRIPGGSWSNYYEWLPCEQEDVCPWDWGVLTPTDFANLINTTGLEAMYTINMNGTAKEAAALVAFFNGSADDDTLIGEDVLGRDWGAVSDWAALRGENGNPDPVNIMYWEIGNEVYAGKPDMGTDCTFDWGWEDVWTCDGIEYVTGIGSGENRKEGFLDYVAAMKAVDPNIQIGAVGVSPQEEWSNWGNEVLAEAGEVMDFYVIHHYGFFDPPESYQDVLALPQATWEPMMADVETSLAENANGRSLPIAITEYNLFSFQDGDTGQWMTQAVNMLYLADTLGQMAAHGFEIANQWALANGQAGNGTDYGLLNADTFDRYPQYFVYPLWSQVGTTLAPVTSPFASDTELSAYAGTDETGAVSLLAINKTGDPITAPLQLLNTSQPAATALAYVVQAEALDSQTVTYNGVENPAADLSDAPPTELEIAENKLSYTFAPYSLTLIRFEP